MIKSTKYLLSPFFQTFEAMRSVMLQKGNVFLEKMMTARGKIASKGAERLPDGAVSYLNFNFFVN